MAETSKPFIPRTVITLCVFLSVSACVTIGILAFYLPAHRIRRDYSLTFCIANAASVSCSGECRSLTVSAPAFDSFATIILSGRRNAPCNSVDECDEQFPCRFMQTPEGVAVREEVRAFPTGLILFIILAAIQTIALFLYLANQSLLQCGIDFLSDDAVRLVIFMPPGVDSVAIVEAVRSRWPRLDARALAYRTYIEAEGRAKVDAREAFDTPPARTAQGLVFCVTADGRNDRAVLSAVPETFYRMLVLPQLEDCVRAMCRRDGEDCVVNEVLSRQISAREGSIIATGEVEKTHHTLTEMSDHFDSVYTVGSWEFGNNMWIARRAVSPYIPLRIAITSLWMRTRIGLGIAFSRLFRSLCCFKDGDRNTMSEDAIN